jgi:hypothetical protein
MSCIFASHARADRNPCLAKMYELLSCKLFVVLLQFLFYGAQLATSARMLSCVQFAFFLDELLITMISVFNIKMSKQVHIFE